MYQYNCEAEVGKPVQQRFFQLPKGCSSLELEVLPWKPAEVEASEIESAFEQILLEGVAPWAGKNKVTIRGIVSNV